MNNIFILVVLFFIIDVTTNLIKKGLENYIQNDFLNSFIASIIIFLFILFYVVLS